MGQTSNYRDFVGQFAHGGRGMHSRVVSERTGLTPELQKYLHIMGPTPKRCLETLADIGLSDDEIGRYFQMPCELVTELRDIWKIEGNT